MAGLSEHVKEKGTVAGFEGKLSNEQLLSLDVDVLVPAAVGDVLTRETAPSVKAKAVVEGANMPTTPEGVDVFLKAKILYGPGKAANAGGVSVSGLEMSQNSLRLMWSREEVDERLRGIMAAIHEQCMMYGYDEKDKICPYVNGANIGGFKKVADSIIDQGLV